MYGPHAKDDDDRKKGSVRRAWLVAFPRAVRKRKRAMLLATALFFVPFVLGAGLALHDPTFAFRVVPEAMLRPLTEAYAKGFSGGREAGEGAMMAGFYVLQHVGSPSRCFALGIFAGLGSAFYLPERPLHAAPSSVRRVARGRREHRGLHHRPRLPRARAIVLAAARAFPSGGPSSRPRSPTRDLAPEDGREILVIVAAPPSCSSWRPRSKASGPRRARRRRSRSRSARRSSS